MAIWNECSFFFFFSLFGYCICLFGHFSHFRMKNESNQIKWSHKAMCPCVCMRCKTLRHIQKIFQQMCTEIQSQKRYIYTHIMLYSNGACTRTCNHAKTLFHPSQSFSSKSNSVPQPARHWNEMKVGPPQWTHQQTPWNDEDDKTRVVVLWKSFLSFICYHIEKCAHEMLAWILIKVLVFHLRGAFIRRHLIRKLLFINTSMFDFLVMAVAMSLTSCTTYLNP